MENHMIAVLASAIQRSSNWWANPQEFDPDRFLSPETHSIAAWQAFEKGPRNCIGQQLAMLEAKVVLVVIARYFDFEASLKIDGPSVEGWGGRAYQELKTTASPKDGLPMRVKLSAE
jgi:cytochrome P450